MDAKSGADPYLKNGVLRNRLDIADSQRLQVVEARVTAVRVNELASRPIEGRFDLSHLQAIHKHIFQDIYSWAGEIRTVDIAKNNTMFARSGFVVAAGEKLFKVLARENHLKNVTGAAYVERAAHYLGELNALHPFREGNGRAQRVFMAQLAQENGYKLDFTRVSRAEMLAASIQSDRDNSGLEKALARSLVDQDRENLRQIIRSSGVPQDKTYWAAPNSTSSGKVVGLTQRYVVQMESKANEALIVHPRAAVSSIKSADIGRPVSVSYDKDVTRARIQKEQDLGRDR